MLRVLKPDGRIVGGIPAEGGLALGVLIGGRASGKAKRATPEPQVWTPELFSKRVKQLLKVKPPVEQQRLLRATLIVDEVAFLDAGQERYGQPFVYNLLRLSPNELASVADRIGQDCYGLLDAERDDPVVMAIGAHIGILGIFAKAKRPKSRVIVRETDPDNVAYLRRSMERFDDIDVVQAAVLDAEEDLTLFRSKRIDWRSSLRVVADFEERVRQRAISSSRSRRCASRPWTAWSNASASTAWIC